MLGNNLPSKSDVVKMYQSYGITAMRIYSPDSATLNALKGTNINLMIDVPNSDLGSIASSSSAAATWVNNNIKAYSGVSFKSVTLCLDIGF
jgi:Glycosyl hydrolases family 17